MPRKNYYAIAKEHKKFIREVNTKNEIEDEAEDNEGQSNEGAVCNRNIIETDSHSSESTSTEQCDGEQSDECDINSSASRSDQEYFILDTSDSENEVSHDSVDINNSPCDTINVDCNISMKKGSL